MDELQLLLRACGTIPYRSNAFRLLALPVDASARDVNKKRDRILMDQRLGSDFAAGAGFLPLRTAPSANEIRLAAEALHDSASRLVQELFWFWPREPGQAAQDPALKALQEGAIDDALYLWLDAAKQDGAADIARHNLAVLAHACACELQLQDDPKTAPPDSAASNDCWVRAFKHWLLLSHDNRFWERLAKRIRTLDDPQLSADMAEKFRRALGPAVLSINADFAVKAVEAGNAAEAGRHAALIKQSGFAAETIEQALHRAAQPIVERITSICQKAKKAAQESPAQAQESTRNLLSETQQNLAIIALFFSPGHLTYESAHDEVALAALDGQIIYGNQTKDWRTCVDLLQKINAGGASTKTRVEENAAIVGENYLGALCQTTEAASKANPNTGAQAARTLLAEAQSALGQFPASHPRYEMVHDMVVSCALSSLIAHDNQTKDWATSLDVLKKIQPIAVSATAKQRMQADLQIVQESLVMQQCQQAVERAKREPLRAHETAETLLDLLVPRLSRAHWDMNRTTQLPGVLSGYNVLPGGLNQLPFLGGVTPVVDSGHPRHQALYDEVAQCTIDCAIIYGNQTKDWTTVLFLLQRIQQIAASPAVKARLAENMRIVESNKNQGYGQYGYPPPASYPPPVSYLPPTPGPYGKSPLGKDNLWVFLGLGSVVLGLALIGWIAYWIALVALIVLGLVWFGMREQR